MTDFDRAYALGQDNARRQASSELVSLRRRVRVLEMSEGKLLDLIYALTTTPEGSRAHEAAFVDARALCGADEGTVLLNERPGR